MHCQGSSNIGLANVKIVLRTEGDRLLVRWNDDEEVLYYLNDPDLVFSHNLEGDRFTYLKEEGVLRNERGDASRQFQVFLPQWSSNGLGLSFSSCILRS